MSDLINNLKKKKESALETHHEETLRKSNIASQISSKTAVDYSAAGALPARRKSVVLLAQEQVDLGDEDDEDDDVDAKKRFESMFSQVSF